MKRTEMQGNEKKMKGTFLMHFLKNSKFSNDWNACLKITFSLLKRAHCCNIVDISFLKPPAAPEYIYSGPTGERNELPRINFIWDQGPN